MALTFKYISCQGLGFGGGLKTSTGEKSNRQKLNGINYQGLGLGSREGGGCDLGAKRRR